MNIEKEILDRMVHEARNDDASSIHSIEKHCFQVLLLGMIQKLLGVKGERAEKQLAALKRMERFLERLSYQNVIFMLQAKLLNEQDRQIALLEQEKMELIEENTELKKRIK